MSSRERMDFLRGDFSFQPVISVMSFRTSSAVVRNSGLLLVAGGVEGVGAGCWDQDGATFANPVAIKHASTNQARGKMSLRHIESQDSRLSAPAPELSRQCFHPQAWMQDLPERFPNS